MSYSFPSTSAHSLDHSAPSDNALGHDAQFLPEGQGYDRVLFEEQNTNEMSASDHLNITTGQRMISATWGSVLTSLLGKGFVEQAMSNLY